MSGLGKGRSGKPIVSWVDTLMAEAIMDWGGRRANMNPTRTWNAFLTQHALYGQLFGGPLLHWSWFLILGSGETAPGSDTMVLVRMLVEGALPLLVRADSVPWSGTGARSATADLFRDANVAGYVDAHCVCDGDGAAAAGGAA